ncbi:right-handed parallel beta-helix repeat-containing protein [Acinetobacter pittii]|uniref:right-handed parallel beta-helix repeat-containing protein n=1 Tax=Acinetobacter pittii TaxID=48296 RepID=UPI002DBCA7DC|nr:right-handed parallel beta-helix repeat-containing protein [Acinetobacter pittii]MEB6670655.1 right-handed parallel beta-helix repeat-containing protein [Acinetobacter pittii]
MAIIISGNKVYGSGSGTGIKVEGKLNASILKNTITSPENGIEVDSTVEGSIADNEIVDYKNVGIKVVDVNPYSYFGIPNNIDKNDIIELFKKLDSQNIDSSLQVMKDSWLSKIDQFTSIAERIHNFVRLYGPSLLITFSPYLNSIM